MAINGWWDVSEGTTANCWKKSSVIFLPEAAESSLGDFSFSEEL
jgi:hypothetical protein